MDEMQEETHCQQVGATAGGEILGNEALIPCTERFQIGVGGFFQQITKFRLHLIQGGGVTAGKKAGILRVTEQMQKRCRSRPMNAQGRTVL